MNQRSRLVFHTLYILTAVLLLLFTNGCSGNDKGFGVVLWGGNTFSLKPGVIVDVHDGHRMDNTLTVSLRSDNVRFEVQKGYIKRFSDKAAARRFRSRYAEYFDLYASANMNGTVVRKKPSQSSDQVYRLRKGERVKVVLSESASAKAEGRRGSWYLVVTKDGYRGYAFGPFLSLHGEDERVARSKKKDRTEVLLERLYGTAWRPEYMRQGIRRERINLERLDPSIGLFPDRDAHTLRLHTREKRTQYSLENIRAEGKKSLLIEEGNLTLTFLADNTLMAEYMHHGEIVQDRFVRLETALEKRINEEKQRRRKLYAAFLQYNGRSFESEVYGTLHFLPEARVHWSGRYDVPPSVLPPDAGETGRVLFNLEVADALKERYDGAFTMRFPVGERETRARFLYNWRAGGLQLTYLPEEAVSQQKVEEREELFLVLFFHPVTENSSLPPGRTAD
jgi:hypothetical protein